MRAPSPANPAAVARSVSAPTTRVVRRAVSTPAARRGFEESLADYRYVASDLKKISVLAGGLVVFLIVLSFVLPMFGSGT
jgi:hypothetical protein